jgi:hypothetical protein
MEYKIPEKRLYNIIYQYIDSIYDVNEIHWTHPYEYDELKGEEGEDPCRITFYRGDYDQYDEPLFRWYDKCYWNTDSWQGTIQYDRSPILSIEDEELSRMYSHFGDFWKTPFLDWFTNNFKDISVKSVLI